MVANLARAPQGGDRDQLRGIAAGEGDIAVANTYYAAKLAAGSEEDRAVMDKVGVIFPNQEGRGAHVNLSGAGVVVGAANKDNAVRFIEFLTGATAQEAFATANKEYPVVPGYALAPELVAFGEFKEDELNVAQIGSTNQQALMVMDRCGWR